MLYIKHVSLDRLINEAGLSAACKEKVGVIRENVKTVRELKEYISIFDGDTIDSDAIDFISGINGIADIIETLEDSIKKDSIKSFEDLYDKIKSNSMLTKKEVMMSLRVILTGKISGPPIKEVFPLISKESIFKRLQCLKKRFSID